MLCLRQSRRFLVLLVLEAVDYVFHHHIPDRAVHVETVSDRANRDVSIRDDPAQAITIAYGQCTDIEIFHPFCGLTNRRVWRNYFGIFCHHVS